MKKISSFGFLKSIFASILLISFVVPNIALASVTVNVPTLNGGATVSVQPGATIAIQASVTTTSNEDWESTSYRIGSSGNYTCVNTSNFSSSGTNTVTFNITAPTTPGTYNLEVRAHGSSFNTNDNCSTSFGGQIGSRTVTNAVTVNAAPTNGTLVVKKNVIGDGVASSFQFQVDGGALTNYEADGQNDISVVSGNHTVTEPAISGYTNTYSNSLNANANCNNLTVPGSGTVTCTISSTKTPNAISNPSFEQGAGNTATSWSQDDFATIPATFTVVAGRQSDRAAQVSIATTPLAGADAKWLPTAVSVTPGQYYTFSFWYKSSTSTELDFIYNGSQFNWISDLPASSDWARYETSFIVPANVTSVQPIAILASQGVLTTDDYQLVLGTAPVFDQGRVTLTFDDGWKSFFTNGVPVLNAAHLKATAYINSQPITDNFTGYMSSADVTTLQNQGYDIGGHSTTHADLTLPTTNLTTEIDNNRTFLKGLASTSAVDTFAYPYGAYNDTVISHLQSAGYIGARTVDQGFNFSNTDKFKLKIQHVTNLTTASEVQGWINQAVTDKTWLILMFHEIVNNYPADCQGANEGNGTTECASTSTLQSIVNYINQNNVCTLTMTEALHNAPCNHLPTLNAIPNQTVVVNNTLTFTATASDPDNGNTLSFSLSNAPQGATIASTTGVFTWTTDVTNVGTTTATVTASDGHGGTASQVVNIEVLPDTVAPTVTISTPSLNTNAATIPVTVVFSENVNWVYELSHFAVTGGTVDNVASTSKSNYSFNVVPGADGDVTVKILSGVAKDLSNNGNFESNTLTINSDRTKPVITLNGLSNVATTTGNVFFDEGATASDNHDGDLTSHIFASSTVNMSLPGAYTVTYSVTDAAGNIATPVIRTVTVSDQSGPTINVPADMTVEATSALGAEVNYTLPTATDAVDGDVSASVVCSPVASSTFPIGENIVSCTAHDNAASSTPNTSAASFKVIVKDTTAPTITAPVTQTFEASGPLTTPTLVSATTTDLVDAAPVVTYAPHSFAVGTTTVTWTATDASGNASTVTSEVVITDTGVPTITLNGAAIVFLPQNGAYSELGATASDVVDGALTPVINATAVDMATEGEYFVTYNVTDSEGNAAVEVKRKVVVSSLEVSDEASNGASHNNVTINWTTNHPATSRIVWDTVSHPVLSDFNAPNYGYANSTSEDANLVTNHSVVVEGLSAETTYYFRTISHGSPEVASTEITITTSATPAPVSNPNANRGGGGGGGIGGRRQIIALASSTPAGEVLGATTGTSKFIFTKNLSIGSIGSEVAELQMRLTAEGVYSGPISGYFGPMTKAALESYQAKNGIEALGIVGPLTRAKLNGGAVLGVSTTSSANGMTIEQMKALLIKLQEQLKELLAKQASMDVKVSANL